MPTPVEEIKSRLDIAEFIGNYVELRPAGKSLKGLCPFHGEKTPSFIVSPERQSWHCFGACSEGGDIFTFVMKYEQVEFYEALKLLAEKAGVELKRISPADQREFGVLYDMNEAALAFFGKKLGERTEAADYLASRGVSKESVEEFGIGYAGTSFDELTVHLAHLGFEMRDIVRSGLVARNERGQHFDRFRGRVMFPLRNTFGRAVAFSGRILPELDNGETPKYLNSPETPIFSKSKLLYGLSSAKRGIREEGCALILEGYMDVLMAHQDGVKNAVGISGTALTRDHLGVLKRHTDRLVLSFDNDEAGRHAAERSIDLALEHDFTVHILDMSRAEADGRAVKDVADMVSKSPGLLNEFARANILPAMEYYLARHVAGYGEPGAKIAIRHVLGKIRRIASPVERSHWIRRAADASGLRESALIEEMNALAAIPGTGDARSPSPESAPHKEQTRQLSRRDRVALELLAIVARFEALRELAHGAEKYLPPRYKEAYNALVFGLSPESAEGREAANEAELRSGLIDREEERCALEARALVSALELEYLVGERDRLYAVIREREQRGEETLEQSREFHELSRRVEELRRVKSTVV
ncbi:MAG: DNA primase [Candidatus Colwellbacteria bacterium]|nr:DNA primase [Candidatus Colwellbacteria bacterium]